MIQDPNVERLIRKSIEPLNKQISMLQIELEGLKKQLAIPRVVSSAMYKATFSFFKDNPRGGRGQWCTEIVPLEAKNDTDLKEKIATYLANDHNSYHTHIKLKDIELM